MKIMVISDLHNDVPYTKVAVELFKKEHYDKMYVLGDILEDSISILNPIHDKILAVRGNNDGYDCDDIALFPLPYITFDYEFGKFIVLTHGHYYNPYNYDQPFDIMLLGHSHVSGISVNERKQIIANPGSLAYPRDYNHSYMVIDEKGIRVLDINSGEVIHKLDF